MNKFRRIAYHGRVWWTYSAAFLLMICLWRIMELPSNYELSAWLSGFSERGLFVAAFVGGIIEGTVLIGAYLPGSLLLVISAFSTNNEPIRFVVGVLGVVSGYIVAIFINSILFSNFARSKIGESSSSWWIAWIHPNLAVPMQVEARLRGESVLHVLKHSVFPMLVWTSLWFMVFGRFRPILNESEASPVWVSVILCLIGTVVGLSRTHREDARNLTSTGS